MPVIADRAGSKNHHSQQEQDRGPFGHAALMLLIHCAQDITTEAQMKNTAKIFETQRSGGI